MVPIKILRTYSKTVESTATLLADTDEGRLGIMVSNVDGAGGTIYVGGSSAVTASPGPNRGIPVVAGAALPFEMDGPIYGIVASGQQEAVIGKVALK